MGELISAIENNRFESLLIVGVIIVFIWLFKEQRNQYIEDRKEINNIALISLSIYSRLYNELKTLDNIDFELLEKYFQEAIPYLPKESIHKYFSFIESPVDDKFFQEFKLEIKNEILRVKKLQKNIVTYRQDKYIDLIDHTYYTSRLDSIIKPFMQSAVIFTIFFSVLFISVRYINHGFDLNEGLGLITRTMSLIFLFFVVLIVFDLIDANKFNKSLINWLFLITLFSITLFFLFLKSWYFGIVSLLITLFIIYYLLIQVKREKSS